MKEKRLLLFLVLFFTLSACAAGTSTIPASVQEQRKAEIAQRLLQLFPGYAENIVNDPRFTFEPRLARRYAHEPSPQPKPPVSPKPKKHDFDYVVDNWSKETGLKFMTANADVLTQAEIQFLTIPKEIPVGILDAETQYGEALLKADYPVLQTLLTIAVFRSDFQRNGWAETQLVSFLRICEKNHWDPFQKFGSRTGAFGKPQFEPSSYEDLAMHWNGSACESWKVSAEPADLNDDHDAVCSIFNYLHARGFGGNESRWRISLYSYNKDWYYCDAILDAADFFAGRSHRPHYQLVTKRKTNLRAAIK